MVFANPSLAIISHTWAEDLSVSQFLITITIITECPIIRFHQFYLKIPGKTVENLKKFLCFSQVFFEPEV